MVNVIYVRMLWSNYDMRSKQFIVFDGHLQHFVLYF